MTMFAGAAADPDDRRLSVFISYSRRDLAFAEWLVAALERRGFDVLIDRRDLPALEDWERELLSFIRAADTVVFVVSPHSVRSQVCAWEVEQVRLNGKRLAPVVIADVENEAIPAEIARIQYVSFLDPTRSEETADNLARALNTNVGWLKEHTRLGELARRWQDRGQTADTLIRGGDLDDAGTWVASRPREAPIVTPQILDYLAAARLEQSRQNAEDQQRIATTRRFQRRAAIGLAASALLVLAMLAGSVWLARETARREAAVLTSSAHRAMADGLQQRAMRIALHGLPQPGRMPFVTLGWESPEMRALEAKLAGSAQVSPLLRVLQHTHAAHRADVSLDGKEVATVAFGDGVHLWSLENGKRRLKLTAAATESLDAKFSPDGTRIATISKSIHIWDAGNGRLTKTINGSWLHIADIAWSPDGRSLAVASYRTAGDRYVGALAMYDLAKDEFTEVLPDLSGYRVFHPVFNPSGTILGALCEDGTLRVFDTKSRIELKRFRNPAQTISFSPDGSRFVSSGSDGVARVWSTETGAQMMSLTGHTGAVSSAVYSQNGAVIVTASKDQTARVWNATTGAEIVVLKGQRAAPNIDVRAIINNDGTRAVTTSGTSEVFVWDTTRTREAVKLGPFENWINRAAFSRDGKTVGIAGNFAAIRLAFDSDENDKFLIVPEGTVRPGTHLFVNDIAFAPDSQYLAAAYTDGKIRVWSVKTARVVRTLDGHAGPVRRLAYTTDGSKIVSGGEDKTVRIWNAATAALEATVPGPLDRIEAVTASPDGRRVIAAGNGSGRDCSTRGFIGDDAIVRFMCHTYAAAFNPDGKTIVTGDASSATIWDASSGKELRTLAGHTGQVLDAAFSRDGSRIVTASVDRSVRVWDSASGAELVALRGHESNVHTARFSPDETRIISGGMDRTVRLWNGAFLVGPRREVLLEKVTHGKLVPRDTAFSQDDLTDPIIQGLRSRPSILSGTLTLPNVVQDAIGLAGEIVGTFGYWPLIVGALAAIICGFAARLKHRSVAMWAGLGFLFAAIAVPVVLLLPSRRPRAEAAKT